MSQLNHYSTGLMHIWVLDSEASQLDVFITESTLNLLTAYWPSVFWLNYK